MKHIRSDMIYRALFRVSESRGYISYGLHSWSVRVLDVSLEHEVLYREQFSAATMLKPLHSKVHRPDGKRI